MSKKRIFSSLSFCLLCNLSSAQIFVDSDPYPYDAEGNLVGTAKLATGHYYGIEGLAYPAGFQPTFFWEQYLSQNTSWSLHGGFNFTDRSSWGEHDDESGWGFGAGVRGLYHFSGSKDGLFAGARLDLFQLYLDWEDEADDDTPSRSGSSDVLMIQPTLQGGYQVNLSDHRFLRLNVGLGGEFNLSTSGEDVGEGAIFLIGFSYGF